MNEQIARYREIERRGLLNQLPAEKQQAWAEIKRRGLDESYSALEKAKYMGRAGAEGLTFGLGDLVAGATNTVMAPIGKVAAHITEGTPISASDFNPLENFKQGRREFVDEQKDFAEEHPGLNFAGEIIGGLGTGIAGAGKKVVQTAGKQGLKALANESARQGAKYGMYYGAGSGLTQDSGTLSIPNALTGGAIGLASGAALGAALAPAGYMASRMLGKSANNTAQQGKNAALARIVEQNPELVQRSISEETPLINIADKKLFRTTRGAVSTDPEAEQILSDYARKFNEGKAAKVEGLINEQLGPKSSQGVIEDIIMAGRQKYQPIYEEVMKAGDLQIPIINQRVLNAMNAVAKEYPELNKLPATDIRVLDLVKQKLDDQINVALRKGANNQARLLSQAKNELVAQIDAKVPQYAEARKAFRAMKELEDLVAQGQNVKQLGREELGTLYERTSPEERQAIKAGIRDVLIRDLDRINQEGANSVKKVFSPSMINKLQRIGLGNQDIVNAIEAEGLANANIQGVFGGSNTAQKIADILNNTQNISVGRAVMQPVRTARRYGIKAIDYLANKIQNSSPAETARLMTDPKYLKSEYERLYGGINKIVKEGNKGKGSVVDTLGNKLKEEGGYAMKDLSKKYTVTPNVYDNVVDVHAKAGMIENAPKKWLGQTIEEAKKALGFNGKKYTLIKTPIEDVTINEGHLQHLFVDNNPERKHKLMHAIGALKKPNIILETVEDGNKYRNYIKLYQSEEKGVKPHLQIVKVKDDGSFYVTNFPPTKNQLTKKIKEGQIVYDSSNVRDTRATKNSGAIYNPSGTTPVSVTNSITNKPQNVKGIKQVLQYADEPFAKNPESIKNFQKWSDNAPFVRTNEEALKDPFKTGEKVVVKAYHGTQRADRVGNVFRPDRATSGPMPMFSSSEEIAKGYMNNKADTSIRANEDISYENWFRIKNKGKEVKLDEAWYQLSPKQREVIAQNAPHIRQDDQALNVVYDPNNWSGLGGYKEHLRDANGNHLKALVDEWLNSGSLYDSEEQFAEVLKKAGLKDSQFIYDNPYATKGDVFNTYIQFKKPLVTTDIPQNVINKLEEVAKKQPIPEPQFGVDLWDKNTRNPLEWIKDLKADYKSGKNSYVWSSIPDWVTNVLKDFGYDGIIDRGGKGGGGDLHRVYIPFKSNQIKSVNNKGTFSKRSPNIYKSLIGGLGISQILKNKENK